MFDLVAVLAPENQGWILDRVCREVAAVHPDRSRVHVWDGSLPPSRAYYFSHYSLFLAARELPAARSARLSVFFTHPPNLWRERLWLAQQLRRVTVLSMSSTHARGLVRTGLPRRAVHVVIPGADPERFRPHVRGRGSVGFCSAYYPRKNPERVLDIARHIPDRQVLLLGKGWADWPRWPELAGCDNVDYRELPYDEYPAAFDEIDVFVSPSNLEGGPIPLLEAMMANAVPVATRTGFAPDLIDDGRNGFVVPVGAAADRFVTAIERAYATTADIATTVRGHTWTAFAQRTYELATAGDANRSRSIRAAR